MFLPVAFCGIFHTRGTFKDSHFGAGLCTEPVSQAEPQLYSFRERTGGKVVQFGRLEMLNFFFSTRKLYLDIQMQSRSSVIRLLLFVGASGFYFFSLASLLCCYYSYAIGFMT